MRRLSLAEVEESRWTRGDSVLLFITDRCPVGCRHCSVDSRPDSPRITDFALFEQIIAGLAASPVRVVGISGGEPFVERRGLSHAVRELDAAGKSVVPYTSGFWANTAKAPAWIQTVLDRCACVFLSTDAFHQAGTGHERFRNAARAIVDRGTALVVQVLDLDAEVERAEGLLAEALGPGWTDVVEMNRVPLLPYGRAEGIYSVADHRPIGSFGSCRVARARVVRYDGSVSACCNEAVLMGAGPAWFRKQADSSGRLLDVLAEFGEDAMLKTIAQDGVGRLAEHPLAADLATREASGMCGACWRLVGRISRQDADRDLVAAPIAASLPAPAAAPVAASGSEAAR